MQDQSAITGHLSSSRRLVAGLRRARSVVRTDSATSPERDDIDWASLGPFFVDELIDILGDRLLPGSREHATMPGIATAADGAHQGITDGGTFTLVHRPIAR